MASDTRRTASSWPTTRSCSLSSILQQLVALALHHLGHRDAGGARHHLGDFLRADLGAQQPGLRACASSAFSAFFSCASSCGSLPYCSSATLSSSPFALQLGHLQRAASRALP